jgi:ribonuclease T2
MKGKLILQHRGRQLEHDPWLRKWKFWKSRHIAPISLWGGFIAAFLLLAWSAPLAQGSRGDQPGDFDYYILALGIAPSFCMLEGNNEGKHECTNANDASYREIPLTVHGLWPNKARKSVNAQPHDCSAEAFSGLPGDLTEQLRRYMPGASDGLDRYEWRKHGVCSGLSPASYFDDIVLLAKRANATIGAIMKENNWLGQNVRIDDLLDAIASRNPALAQAIVVKCRFERGQPNGRRSLAYIDEIRVILSKNLSKTPRRTAG